MQSLDRPLNQWVRNFGMAITVSCALSLFASAAPKDTGKNAAKDVPVYKVDPFWPKPLPHHWLMQGVPVMVVDKDDHIWVMNRPRDVNPDEIGAASTPPRTDCCVAAPAVLEFDTEGNLLQGLGRPGLRAGMAGRRQSASRSGRRTRHSGGSRRKRLDFRQRARRHHHEIHGRWQAAVGVWSSRTTSQARRSRAARQAK